MESLDQQHASNLSINEVCTKCDTLKLNREKYQSYLLCLWPQIPQPHLNINPFITNIATNIVTLP